MKNLQQLQDLIQNNNIRVDGDDLWLTEDGEEGLINPWCYEVRDGDSWQGLCGVRIDKEEARKHLYSLASQYYPKQVRMHRGNWLPVYVYANLRTEYED